MAKAFGVVAGALNTIDVTYRAIDGLIDLCDRWKNTDLALDTFISQWRTVRVALRVIRRWLHGVDKASYDELVLDANASILQCSKLLDTMCSNFDSLRKNSMGDLELGSRIEFVLTDQKKNNYQAELDYLVNELTLLLQSVILKGAILVSHRHSLDLWSY